MVDCEKAARLTFVYVVLLGLELFLKGFLNGVSDSWIDLALELLQWLRVFYVDSSVEVEDFLLFVKKLQVHYSFPALLLDVK